MIDRGVTLSHCVKARDDAERARVAFAEGKFVQARALAQSAMDELTAVVIAASQREGANDAQGSHD